MLSSLPEDLFRFSGTGFPKLTRIPDSPHPDRGQDICSRSHSWEAEVWYSGASSQWGEEDSVKKGVIQVIGLAIGLASGFAFLAGCGNQGNKSSAVPAEPKWKGAPYRLTLDTKAVKPTPAAVTIPPVSFTANPEALETRALLVMRFSGPAAGGADPVDHLMIGRAVDIHGEQGTLPADYLDQASKSLSDYLVAHCIQGDVKVSISLARSSLNPLAQDAEVDAKRLSDWVSFGATFKKPHMKC
jgi:hypothetical protein